MNPEAAWNRRRLKAAALLTFLRYPRELRRRLYTTNQLKRVRKETRRRTKVVDVPEPSGVVEKLLYLVLYPLNERLATRRLRGSGEVEMRN